jgi:hypothetical protein
LIFRTSPRDRVVRVDHLEADLGKMLAEEVAQAGRLNEGG